MLLLDWFSECGWLWLCLWSYLDFWSTSTLRSRRTSLQVTQTIWTKNLYFFDLLNEKLNCLSPYVREAHLHYIRKRLDFLIIHFKFNFQKVLASLFFNKELRWIILPVLVEIKTKMFPSNKNLFFSAWGNA